MSQKNNFRSNPFFEMALQTCKLIPLMFPSEGPLWQGFYVLEITCDFSHHYQWILHGCPFPVRIELLLDQRSAA